MASHNLYGRLTILFSILMLCGCPDPAEYEDKDAGTTGDVAQNTDAGTDSGTTDGEPVDADGSGTTDGEPVDADGSGTTDGEPVDADGSGTTDGEPVDADSSGTTDGDAAVPADADDKDTAEPTDIDTPATSCVCTFSLVATSPLNQSFVWLTGDFMNPPWPGGLEAGAVPLEFNAAVGAWAGDVELQNGATVEYKYLVGWADNPGPHWRTQDGDISADAPNSVLTAVCGQAPCQDGL